MCVQQQIKRALPSVAGCDHHLSLEAERRRVAGIIARDRPTPSRIDAEGKRKRRGETNAQHRLRVANMELLEKPIDEASMTPETAGHGDYHDAIVMEPGKNTTIQVKRNRMASSLQAMADKGQITALQLSAALEIASIAEIYEKHGRVRGQEIRERVDGGGAGVGPLVVHLTLARLERAYTNWRDKLPMPKRMIIDMLVQDQALFATARSYGMGWPKARGRLIDALTRWESVKDWAWDNVDQRDLDWIKMRIEV